MPDPKDSTKCCFWNLENPKKCEDEDRFENQPLLPRNCDADQPKNQIKECCSVFEPCAINQGDCDTNLECQGDLVCGFENCNLNGVTADCCESPSGTN